MINCYKENSEICQRLVWLGDVKSQYFAQTYTNADACARGLVGLDIGESGCAHINGQSWD